MRQIIRDAKKQLDREAPKKAFELACVIPIQLQADGDARERAVEVLNDAAKALKGTDGFDTSELEQRLEQAESALEAGDTGQSIGLAEGVVRVIQIERNPWRLFDVLFDSERRLQIDLKIFQMLMNG